MAVGWDLDEVIGAIADVASAVGVGRPSKDEVAAAAKVATPEKKAV